MDHQDARHRPEIHLLHTASQCLASWTPPLLIPIEFFPCLCLNEYFFAILSDAIFKENSFLTLFWHRQTQVHEGLKSMRLELAHGTAQTALLLTLEKIHDYRSVAH
jgi:hypothetical protein